MSFATLEATVVSLQKSINHLENAEYYRNLEEEIARLNKRSNKLRDEGNILEAEHVKRQRKEKKKELAQVTYYANNNVGIDMDEWDESPYTT
jgi:superfamily II RNA helicase